MKTKELEHYVDPEPEDPYFLVESVVDDLELIKKRSEDLRNWGQEWREKALEYYSYRTSLEEKIDDLEGDVENLKLLISDLEIELAR